MAITLQTTKYNVIYIYSRDAHPGLLKIGKTSVDAYDVEELTPNCDKLNQAAYDRFHEAVTFGVTDLHLHHTEVAHFMGSDGKAHMFDDHAVHEVLLNSNYEKADLSTVLGTPDEWFRVSLDNAVKAIAAVKSELQKIDGPKIVAPQHPVIIFRDEQKAAIDMTLDHFNLGGDKMLWNAKMRFGKTLCALELINQLGVKKVMILTHRPTVRSGWFDDYHLIDFKHKFQYGSKNGKASNHLYDKEKYPKEYVEGKDLLTMQNDLQKEGTRYIYFASMQDLRGKKDKNGKKVWKENNKLVYDTRWDLIIFDEAHEGTQTSLGKEVTDDLCANGTPLKLYLSGTPYNILSQFKEEEIFTWDYVMEQEAKEQWPVNHPNETNPYEGLAQLHIYTYNLGEVFANNPNYTKSDDDYFNFAEFFRVWSGDEQKDGKAMPPDAQAGEFMHEQHVKDFLDLMCREEPVSFYPYSNDGFRNALSHTLWMLPGVEQANRLAYLINNHKLHTKYGFEVVSVAGEGYAIDTAGDNAKKIEKQEKDALDRVKKAIKENPRTITLSCGRLTTGVSVPEWTGVFMLSGGYSTGAANYMQTIFRGQTPYKNGAIKSNCYAFDFAPDRTLTVVDDYIKMQPRSKNEHRMPGDGNLRTASTLRFMPIVAMVGGQEVEYDAKSFIHKVNKAYTDHVLAHGFKSRKLFKNFATFKPEDHELLKRIGNLFGGSKVSVNSDGTITMAEGGYTGENGGKGGTKQQKKNAGKKDGDQIPKTKPAKNNELEQRRHSQRVLDYIFVRMPLLLFGTVTNPNGLTIDDLLSENFIDDESWEEFMPRNFTKAMFRQIAHLLQVDVLIASTAEIIRQAKAADDLPIEKRIVEISNMISKFHFPDKETVLTPWRVVNMHMTATLGGYDFYNEEHTRLSDELRLVDRGDITTSVFCDPNTRILELNSKSGVYPLWIACTLLKLQGHEGMTQEEEWSLWKTILEENLYVVCQTRMAEKITRRVLVGYRTDLQPNTVAIEGIAQKYKEAKDKTKLINKIKNMATYNGKKKKKLIEFSAVVGNPPYQVMDGGAQASAAPVYQDFVGIAKRLQPNYISMIMPTRWYAGGRGLDDFREEMLNDQHVHSIHDFLSPDSIFQGTNIRGGICFFLWSASYNNKLDLVKVVTHDKDGDSREIKRPMRVPGFDIFIRDARCLSIIDKVKEAKQSSFEDAISPLRPFGFRGYFVNDASFRASVEGLTQPIICYGKGKKEGFVERQEINVHTEWIDEYKVYIPRANNIGTELNDDNLNGFVGQPKTICTESYLVVGGGMDLSEQECSNICSYFKTHFARYMHSLAKASQDATSKTFKFVPLQDFTSSSDIDWSKSVAEIDQALYKKYGLSDEEVAFIERTIKPME